MINATRQNAVQSTGPALPTRSNEATVIAVSTAGSPAIRSTHREMTGILQVQARNDHMAPQLPPAFAPAERNPVAYPEPTFTQSRKRKTEDVMGASLKRQRTQDSFPASFTLATADIRSSETAKPDTSPELLNALCVGFPIYAATNSLNRTVNALHGHAPLRANEVVRADHGVKTRVGSNVGERRRMKATERLFPSQLKNICSENGLDHVDQLKYRIKAISHDKSPLGVEKIRHVVKVGLHAISRLHSAYRYSKDHHKADQLAAYLVTVASREPAISAAFRMHHLTNAGVRFSVFGITKRLQKLWKN